MTLEQPLISCIIVNWNTKELLLQCVESILRFTDSFDRQIIVVDNGSSDGSVVELKKIFPEVEVIELNENLGFAKANNIGIQHSRGQYVCLINSDIKVLDDGLSKMHAFMEEHPRIGVLAPRLLNRDGTIQQGCWGFPTFLRTLAGGLGLGIIFPQSSLFSRVPALNVTEPIAVDVACGAFWMIRSVAFKDVGLLDEAFFFYGEDVDLCKRFWDAGWQVMYYPLTQVIHYHGQSSSHAPARYAIQLVRARLQYWRKHCSLLSLGALVCAQAFYHFSRILGQLGGGLIFRNRRSARMEKARIHWACLLWLLKGRLLE